MMLYELQRNGYAVAVAVCRKLYIILAKFFFCFCLARNSLIFTEINLAACVAYARVCGAIKKITWPGTSWVVGTDTRPYAIFNFKSVS